ncbi:MAG: alpha-hydroxy-acid oxidizing protein [Alphaproteobacteria bacterium]|nr:alpha-hydroxy-acid oxidizing protein [Alphaproteobacteria bacterium]
MTETEQAWLVSPSRRKALAAMAGFVAASPMAAGLAEPDPGTSLNEVRRIKGLAEMRSTFDFEPLFEGNLLSSVHQYTAHGDGSEFTLRRNRLAYDWVDILPSRRTIAASQVDLSSELLGVKMKFPILVAPSSGQNGLHPEGEVGMFRGAVAASNMVDILSSASNASVQAALKAAPQGSLWSQHYPDENLANEQRALEGVQTAGSKCIVITVDQQASFYERDLLIRNLGGRAGAAPGGGDGNAAAATAAAAAAAAAAGGPAVPGSVRYRVSDRRLWYSWQYIDAVRKIARDKLLLKGILDPEDARLAIEHGADGIIVSNHGGRSMDYGPSTLEVLPEIVAAVNGRIPILFDSGIRRGADIFKALALGANAVCLGRAARWGLGAFGAAGAQRVFEILQQELVQVAAAAGCARLADINRTTVRTHFV